MALIEIDRRFPSEFFLSQRNIRSPSCRIVIGQRHIDDLAVVADRSNNLFRQFKDGEFAGIADVQGPVKSSSASMLRTNASTKSST